MLPWGFLLNPKVLIGLAFAIILAGAYYKYHSLQSDLEEATIALKQEKDNNVVLRDNIDTITQVNAANAKVLQQQTVNAKTTLETITKMSTDLRKKGQSFTGAQTRIESIKETPTPLTPYLKEAINSIQSERDYIPTSSITASTSIQSITNTKEGLGETIRIVLSNPLTVVPPGTVTKSPPRITIDLVGTTNGMGKSSITTDVGGNLRTTSVVQNADRSRVVFNLTKSVGYNTQLEGNALLIILDPPKDAPK